MPRNYDIYGNVENHIPAAPSVLDPTHPANIDHSHSGRVDTYTYRQRNLKLNFTLGWELEANAAPLRIPAGIERISDGSVNGDGAEFVVLPAVTKSPRYVLGLLKDLVHAPRLNTNKSCGFHVHVSASNLASITRMRQWAVATEYLALQVEDLAFKAVPDARHGNSYCRRIVPIENGVSFRSNKYDNTRRYHWLNIVEMFRPSGIRTIEVRLLGNTHRWKYLLAWSLFSMELARRGWEVANKPFDSAGHIDALGQMLIRIAKDIKPLEKKLDPIPQWIYEGLETFDIKPDVWERPLAALTGMEADLQGLPRRVYTDNQPEILMTSGEDNDDCCPCGCGEDGRCEQQCHDDGDCDSGYCYTCHNNGDCQGLPRCERCIDDAHGNGDDCTRRICPTCHPEPRRVVPVANPAPAGVLTAENMWAAVDIARSMGIDNAMIRIAASDALINGAGMATVQYDEAANVSTTNDGMAWLSGITGDFYQPPISDTVELERRAGEMLESHEEALSADREHTRLMTATEMTLSDIRESEGQ